MPVGHHKGGIFIVVREQEGGNETGWAWRFENGVIPFIHQINLLCLGLVPFIDELTDSNGLRSP